MSFYDSLWQISEEEPSFVFCNIQQKPEGEYPYLLFQEIAKSTKLMEAQIDHSLESARQAAETQSEQKKTTQTQSNGLNQDKKVAQEYLEEGKKRRGNNLKQSPYHNFQKHLNTALKHMISLPSPQSYSTSSAIIAQSLWKIFLKSGNSTKKILSLIFNEFNQYCIEPSKIVEFGFGRVYASCSKIQLGEAKTILTQTAIQQLNDENIDDYLETRRIKNAQTFKSYLAVFRNELRDGFLKKRLTNKSRKQQIFARINKQ